MSSPFGQPIQVSTIAFTKPDIVMVSNFSDAAGSPMGFAGVLDGTR